MERVKKIFRLSLDDRQILDGGESLIRDGNIPPFFGVAGFCPAHLVHEVLPSAFDKIRIAVLQINLGDLQIHRRLFAGFIQRI